MKKANNKKLAAIMALVSVLSTKPANALSNLAKGGTTLVTVFGIVGGVFLINYLVNNKKEKGDDESNKKTNPAKVNQKGQYYDENIKMLTENIIFISNKNLKVDKKYSDKLIGFINSKNNDFLGEVVEIGIDDGQHYFKNFNGKNYWGLKWQQNWIDIDASVIKKAELATGNSWVEELFDRLRGSSKITKCKYWVNASEFEIFFNDKVYRILFKTENVGDVLKFYICDAKNYRSGKYDREAVCLVGRKGE